MRSPIKTSRMHAVIRTVICIVAVMCFFGLASVSAAESTTEVEYYGREALSTLQNSDALLYAYDQIAAGVEASASTINVYNGTDSISREEIVMVMDTYVRDYTHHFWLGKSYQIAGYSYSITEIRPTYNMSGDTLTAAKAAYESKVSEILDGITPDMSDYEIELYLHDTLAGIAYYQESDHAHDSYGAIVEGVTVCEGYAEGLQYLLHRAGIRSYICIGSSINPSTNAVEGHAWNYVLIDGEWYHTDLTWDDQGDNLFHAYFNVTDALIKEDHAITETEYELPVCDSMDANYFYGTDEYLSDYTTDTVGEVLYDNNLKAHVFVPGSTNDFLTWYNNNINSIVRATGSYHVTSYSYAYIGKELILELKVSCDHTSLTNTPGVAPTCVESGNSEYYICICGKWFNDASAKSETGKHSNVVLSALGHDYTEMPEDEAHLRSTATSCTEHDTYWYDCSRCDKNAKDDSKASDMYYETEKIGGHLSFGEWAEIDGVYTRVCSDCDTEESFTVDKDINTTPDSNAAGAVLDTTDSELIGKVLTDDDLTEMAHGADVKIYLTVDDITDTVSESDQTAIEDAVDDGNVGMYLNIDLHKSVGTNDTTVFETSGAVTVTITVPDELINDLSNVVRTYRIIRMHNGIADVLNGDFDSGNGTFTFETDKFSTYALAYSDEISYTVIYTDGVENEVIFENQEYTVIEGEVTPAFVGTPEREGYTFDGWDPDIADTVTDHATYTAVWTKNKAASPVKLTVTAPESAISEGEFTVTISASTDMDEAQLLNALNFALNYDSSKLELVSITANSALGGEYVTNGAAFAWLNGANGISVTAEPTVIATAKFVVKSSITHGETTVITLGDNENTKLYAKLYEAVSVFVPDVVDSDSITLNLKSFDFYFITADQYKILEKDTKILAIEADTNNTTYTLGDYNFYWSSKYKAYVAIVGTDITSTNVTSMVRFTEEADTDVLAYDGDIAGDGYVAAGGAALISEMIHNPNSDVFTDRMRLEADVFGTYTEGGAYVTASDAMWILYASVGLKFE